MSNFAIGLQGYPPRMVASGLTDTEAKAQLQAGEHLVPLAVIPLNTAAMYIDGNQLRPRAALNFGSPPAAAMLSVNGGAPVPATAWTAPTTPGTYRAVAVGPFMGETFVIVRSLADEQAYLVGEVKTQAAARKMTVMSPGTAKPEEYRLKAPEIAASANVIASLLNGLTAANAMAQYPMAATEAKLTGEPLATVLTRYRGAAATSDAEVRRLSAIEHAAVAKIKAATTIAAKRAAYAAINWNWTA